MRDRTRLIALPRTPAESVAFAGVIHAAVHGQISSPTPRRFWSVFVQQCLAYSKQNRGDVRRERLLSLACSAWPQDDTRHKAGAIIDGLLAEGTLTINRGLLSPSGEMADRYSGAGSLFLNFDAATQGVTIIDQGTGNVLGNASGMNPNNAGIVIGGRRLRIVSRTTGSVEVRTDVTSAHFDQDSPHYSSQRIPISLNYAQSIRQGLDLPEGSAPAIELRSMIMWFHFGGEIWERLWLHSLPRHMRGVKSIRGVACYFDGSLDDLHTLIPDTAKLSAVALAHWKSLAQVTEKGRFFPELASSDRAMAVHELVDPAFWDIWISSRKIELLKAESPAYQVLQRYLGKQ